MAALAEITHGLLGGVALGDAAEVELHAWCCEFHGGGGGVERELVRAHLCPGGGELICRGQGAGLSRGPPEAGEGADGDIKGTAGVAGDRAGDGEHFEQIRADRLWNAGVLGQAADLAGRAIVAHGLLELGQAVEGPGGGIGGGIERGCIHDDSGGHAHDQAGELVAFRGRSWRLGGRRSHGARGGGGRGGSGLAGTGSGGATRQQAGTKS